MGHQIERTTLFKIKIGPQQLQGVIGTLLQCMFRQTDKGCDPVIVVCSAKGVSELFECSRGKRCKADLTAFRGTGGGSTFCHPLAGIGTPRTIHFCSICGVPQQIDKQIQI